METSEKREKVKSAKTLKKSFSVSSDTQRLDSKMTQLKTMANEPINKFGYTI